MQTEKQLKVVFNDYNTESTIKESKIQALNLIKKENVLEICLASENYIELKELWLFEKFLRERFQLKKSGLI